MRHVITVLERAIELLEKGWCQKCYAEDSDGYSVFPNNPKACRWCLEGVSMRAATELNLPYTVSLEFLRARTPDDDIAMWNDAPDRTQAEVVAFVRSVVKELKEEELTSE